MIFYSPLLTSLGKEDLLYSFIEYITQIDLNTHFYIKWNISVCDLSSWRVLRKGKVKEMGKKNDIGHLACTWKNAIKLYL